MIQSSNRLSIRTILYYLDLAERAEPAVEEFAMEYQKLRVAFLCQSSLKTGRTIQ